MRNTPFADKRDFEEARKGFIAAPTYNKIMADAGNVAWNMGSYDFLLEGKDFDTVNPSLQRQAVLNMAYGLYEVVPDRIYQIRGFDLANITFIKGDTGWICFRHPDLERKPPGRRWISSTKNWVSARSWRVVISHSHADHFGGVRGVVERSGCAAARLR